ncbi:AIR synthase [Clostridium fermenticellae]|uniref:AIR synthase n=1 Tax=Clostridium fermenticellae TaxID=2068654 RepID=A0A386H1K9_9CLOT|nr:AIR synthase family protein [Clostridium fermenticellae]AYD39591.1 AIR synthase [Clostridium fermenticellae]
MKIGKLNWDDLNSIIDNNRGSIRDDIRIRGGIGEDCSVINFGDYECVVSTDPITGADHNSGKLAVHINCNDIASSGVEPIGILVTILAPETCSLYDIKSLMSDINEETKKLNIEVLGGHTEVTSAVNKMIVSCTIIGKGKRNSAVSTSGALPGDDIVVTKKLCLEGTSIIVNDYEEKVKGILTPEEIQKAKNYTEYLSVVKEGIIAGKFKVNSMHDITEGGVLGALWEVSEASKLGFKVYSERMPLSSITKKLCNRYNIDPLRFISSGSMLITTHNGEKLIKELNKSGISGTIIGEIIKDGHILVKSNKEEIVTPPERDELFDFHEKML